MNKKWFIVLLLLASNFVLSGCSMQSRSLQTCVIDENIIWNTDNMPGITNSVRTIENVISVARTREYVIIEYYSVIFNSPSSVYPTSKIYIDLTTSLETGRSEILSVTCE